MVGDDSWNPTALGRRSGGDDHLVGRGLDDQLGVDGRAQVDPNAEPLDLVGEPAGDGLEVRAGRHRRRHPGLSAKLAGHLVEVDLVAPHRCGAGGLEPGRPASDDRAPS